MGGNSRNLLKYSLPAVLCAILWLAACSSSGKGEYPVRGELSGLANSQEVVLQLNSIEITLDSDCSFDFQTTLSEGNPYKIRVKKQPFGQYCSFVGGTYELQGKADSSLMTIHLVCVDHSTLNDTGIAGCSDSTQNRLDCPQGDYPGQDADYGRDWLQGQYQLTKIGDGQAGFDFTKLDKDGNEIPASDDITPCACVRDNHTGLIWENKVDDPDSLHHQDWMFSWYDSNSQTNGGEAGEANPAGQGSSCGDKLENCNTEDFVEAVNAEGLCGAKDWRMPTPAELLSIVHFGKSNAPAVDTDYFPAEEGGAHAYWSGATCSDHEKAWDLNFELSSGLPMQQTAKETAQNIRLIRKPASHEALLAQDSRYTDNQDGTITDKATGLMWKKCSEGDAWQKGGCPEVGERYTWQDALKQAELVNKGEVGQNLGYTDWRVPNIKELESLAEYCGSIPAADMLFGLASADDDFLGYWSSSSDVLGLFPDYAWYLDFEEGMVGSFQGSTGNLFLRLVRGRQ